MSRTQIATLAPVRQERVYALNDMETASASVWDSTKVGFADADKDLHQLCEKAAAQFK